MRRGDDQASSTVFSFIVATSIFAMAFTSVTYFASDYISDNQAEGDSLDSVAAAAIEVLNSHPGAPADWSASAAPSRLGLLKVGTTTTMDGEKLAALASWSGDPQLYDDARASLGLEDYNVRIRSYPTFTTTSEGVTGLEDLQVAYLRSADEVVVDAEVDALAGTGVEFSTAAADTDLTDGYTAGDVFTATHSVLNTQFAPRLHGLLGVHDGAQVAGNDSYWRVIDNATFDTTNAAGPTTRVLTMANDDGDGTWSYGSSRDLLNLATPLDRVLLVEVDRILAEESEEITLELEHWLDGYESEPIANQVIDDYGVIDYYCVEGCIPSAKWVPGMQVSNVGSMQDFASSEYSLENLVPIGTRGYLALTWHSYDDGDPTHSGQGWFVRGAKVTVVSSGEITTWENTLDFSVSRYDALVIGSQVVQANLNDPSDPLFDETLKAWIDQGGDLVVTGSDDAATPWLSDLASGVATQGALGGGFYQDRTDTTHAVLNNPYHLRWSSYSTASKTYKLPSTTTGPFADVVYHRSAENMLVDEAFLSVSSANWRQTYDGIAVITSYQPFAMGPVEAMRFYANALVFTEFNDLEVDFGAQVPAGHDIGTAQRSVVIDASDVGLGYLEGQMVIHTWR